MGLFTKDTKVEDPHAAQKLTAVNFLENLLKGGTPDIPTQDVAGLTDLQRIVQSGLQGQYQDAQGNYDFARDYYTGVAEGDYDPRTSDFYQGLRAEQDELKRDSVTNIRQSAELGGSLKSTPRMGVEAESNRKYDNQTLTQLGGLYENERNRQDVAVSELDRLDANRIAASGNLQAIADLERQIEQARSDAIYSQALQEVLFPYQYQASIASAIFGSSQPVVTGGGLTDLGFAATLGGSLISATGGQIPGSGGGSGGGGFTPSNITKTTGSSVNPGSFSLGDQAIFDNLAAQSRAGMGF